MRIHESTLVRATPGRVFAFFEAMEYNFRRWLLALIVPALGPGGSARHMTTAASAHWLTLAALLAAGCAGTSHVDLPPGEPYVRGPIGSVTHRATASNLLVRGGPGSREPCGISATVDARTTYLVRDASGAVRPGTLAELAPGDTVEVHVEGPVAESCPVQGYASAIVLVGRAAADTSAPQPSHSALPAQGERWGGLLVESVEARPETVDEFGWTGRVVLSGAVTLSGRYRPHYDYPELQETCFFPDSASAARLPRFPNDVRISWFCFQDQQHAARELGAPPASGEATIVIDRMDYLYEHTDTYNTARLREVITRVPD